MLIGFALSPNPAPAADGQPEIRPGLWAYRNDMKVYDVDMPSKAFMRCLTAEDIEKRIKKARISSVKEVFLMTLDDCGNQFIQRKEA